VPCSGEDSRCENGVLPAGLAVATLYWRLSYVAPTPGNSGRRLARAYRRRGGARSSKRPAGFNRLTPLTYRGCGTHGIYSPSEAFFPSEPAALVWRWPARRAWFISRRLSVTAPPPAVTLRARDHVLPVAASSALSAGYIETFILRLGKFGTCTLPVPILILGRLPFAEEPRRCRTDLGGAGARGRWVLLSACTMRVDWMATVGNSTGLASGTATHRGQGMPQLRGPGVSRCNSFLATQPTKLHQFEHAHSQPRRSVNRRECSCWSRICSSEDRRR
jgi:hypothetical protein